MSLQIRFILSFLSFICWSSWELPRYNLKWAPICGRRGEMEERDGHSRLVGGNFTKQRELTCEAYLGWQQDEWIPSAALQILQVCKETLTVLSRVYCAGVFNTTSLSQGYILGATSESRKDKQNPHPKDREGVRSLRVPVSSSRVIWWSCLLDDVPPTPRK